jgi:glycosyltransferase involved in cell wall biosynthesis
MADCLKMHIEKTISDIGNGSYYRRLCNNPHPHKLRSKPSILSFETHNSVDPLQTFVMPAFEQMPTISAAIENMLKHSCRPSDVIIIDDGSSDKTSETVIETLRSLGALSHLCSYVVLRNDVPIFETACDNVGFVSARSEIVIEVQSDLIVREDRFDKHLATALNSKYRPSSVSGRCGHSFDILSRRSKWKFRDTRNRLFPDKVGLTGDLLEKGSADKWRGYAYICDSVVRGPWAIKKSDLESVRYLDEKNFFLGDDDHDFHRRMYLTQRRKPLYVPMNVFSQTDLGANRRERSGINAEIYNELKFERGVDCVFQEFVESFRSIRPIRRVALPS